MNTTETLTNQYVIIANNHVVRDVTYSDGGIVAVSLSNRAEDARAFTYIEDDLDTQANFHQMRDIVHYLENELGTAARIARKVVIARYDTVDLW